MARNRKNQSVAIRFAPALRAALLCAFLGGSAIGYVWQKNQIIGLGRKIKEQESRLGQLVESNQKLSKQLLTLRSPGFLERRVKDFNLQLAQPVPGQILRMVETAPGEIAPRQDLLVAERRPAAAPSSK